MAREMKIGDKVLCVESDREKLTFKGDEYVVDGFACCPKCGLRLIQLVGFNAQILSIHSACGFTEGIYMRVSFVKSRFILPDLESLHAHRVNVSAKELTEIKTHQLS